jgi:glycosyltransferase involved in cell wall biosynthesis
MPHRTIVVSSTLAGYFVERYGKDPTHIPNGSKLPDPRPPDLIREMGLTRDDYVLYVGRLVPEKGCHTLLEAFAQVQTARTLVIAGRIDQRDRYFQQLKEIARDLERVVFVDFVQGVMLEELYSNAYVVVNSSEMEGLSLSLLEALSYGNCLLVSNIPENMEAVGDLAYTYINRDSTDLALQLQRLMDRPDQVETMRVRVLAQFATYTTWHAVAEETRKLYMSLVYE